MSSFSVAFRTQNHVRILDLNGELDAHTAAELEMAIQQSMQDGHVKIIVNGEQLRYISSAGLGVFMAFVEEIRDQNGDLKIAALQPHVYDTFDLLGFPHLFDITTTVSDAILKFA